MVLPRAIFPHIWKQVSIRDLKKGDVFRVFEQDGTPVPSDTIKQEMRVVGEPYVHPELGVWTIPYEELEK